ncbi:hypothetical protein G6F23_015003 [Rhizopus arrhizus]|nr:hypothetical protein G6F23_015003 [Rhizopus arrhizus]
MLVVNQPAAQVGARRPGTRILVHAAACLGKEVAGHHHLARVLHIAFVEGKHVQRLAAQAAGLPAMELGGVRRRATHGLDAGQRHQQLVRAGIHPDRIAQQVIGIQPDQARDLGAVQSRRRHEPRPAPRPP